MDKAERERDRLRGEIDKARREMERALKQAMSEQKKQMEKEQGEHIRFLEERMKQKISEQQRQMEQYVKQAEEAKATLRREMDKKLDELKKLQETYIAGEKKKDEKQEKEAQKFYEEAKAALAELEKQPCEKLIPGKKKYYTESFQDIARFLKMGLYQAAAAAAASVKAAAKRFGYDVEERRQEWEYQYHNFCESVRAAMELEKSLWCSWKAFVNNKQSAIFPQLTRACGEDFWEAEPVDETTQIVMDEVDYWSNGRYQSVRKQILEALEIVRRAEKNGHDAYLKSKDSLGSKELEGYQEILQECQRDLALVQEYACSAYQASCDRDVLMEKIAEYLIEMVGFGEEDSTWQNLTPAEKREDLSYEAYMRRKCESANVEYDTYFEDYRGWLETILVESGTRVLVFLYPQKVGNKVQNHLYYYADVLHYEKVALDLDRQMEKALGTGQIHKVCINEQHCLERLEASYESGLRHIAEETARVSGMARERMEMRKN